MRSRVSWSRPNPALRGVSAGPAASGGGVDCALSREALSFASFTSRSLAPVMHASATPCEHEPVWG